MAEWLGKGLQNLVQQFDSAWSLIHCIEDKEFVYNNEFFVIKGEINEKTFIF